MYVVGADSVLEQIVVEFLGHAFGEGGHQGALVTLGADGNLLKQVVNLVLAGPNLYLGIKQAGGADNLVHHDALALTEFVIGRSGTHINGLSGKFLELLKLEGTVVKCGRQAESVLHQGFLAGAVAAVHGVQLGYTHVAFVNHRQEILGEEIQQAVGTGAGRTAVKVSGVVLNAAAVSQFPDHLYVIFHTLLQALGLKRFTYLLKVGHTFHKVILDGADGAFLALLGGHE